MKGFRACLAALAMVALAGLTASPVLAQQTESRILGRLVDDSQGALPGATVNVTSRATGVVRSVVTDADGTYAVTNLGPGAYTVQAELSGFATQAREIVLGVGQVETLDITLGVAGLQEAVTVSASAQVIDISSARIGVNVSPEELDNLPVNGRNFANLMTLATGATSDGNGGWASVRFNGKSNQQNYLNYDGVDGTYVWDASPGYLNATGSQFRLQTSMESVSEFRVNSGLAPAESGLGAGGNITVITKSGSNAYRGSLFEYKRDDALDAASKYRRPEAGAVARPVRRLHRRAAGAQQDLLLLQLRGAAADDRTQLHRGPAERRGAAAHSRRRTGRLWRGAEPGAYARGGAAAERLPRKRGRDLQPAGGAADAGQRGRAA